MTQVFVPLGDQHEFYPYVGAIGFVALSWAVTTFLVPAAHVWMASAQLRCGRQDQRLIHGTVSLRCLRCSATVGLTMWHGLQIARGRQCDRFRRLRRDTVRLRILVDR